MNFLMATPGAYSSVITTSDAGTVADSGTTPEVTLPGSPAAGSGTGAVAVGGSDRAHPLGWRPLVPAAAYAGFCTSTVTLDLVSGP